MERTRNQMLTDSTNFIVEQAGSDAFGQLKNYLVIRSAFDGIVTQRNVDPGTLVGKKTEWVDIRSGINMKDNIEVFGDLSEGDELLVSANDETKPQKSVVAY
jgi:hypothetical protein